MAYKQAKHLYFIDGPVPTDEQAEHAATLNGIVCFRNATMIDENEDHATEDFDHLHGNVPSFYRAAEAMKRGEPFERAPKADAPATGTLALAEGAGGVKPPTGGGSAAGWRPNA